MATVTVQPDPAGLAPLDRAQRTLRARFPRWRVRYTLDLETSLGTSADLAGLSYAVRWHARRGTRRVHADTPAALEFVIRRAGGKPGRQDGSRLKFPAWNGKSGRTRAR